MSQPRHSTLTLCAQAPRASRVLIGAAEVAFKRDVATSSNLTQHRLKDMGATTVDAETIALVVAELAAHIIDQGGLGRIELWLCDGHTVEIEAHEDGHAHDDAAERDGHGVALGGRLESIQRLMDGFEHRPAQSLHTRTWLRIAE